MGQRLPRFIGSASDMPAGAYSTNPLRHAPGAMLEVAIACPQCRGVTDIARSHVINRAGQVTPAFRCPTETCGYVEWIDLDGYAEPVITEAEVDAKAKERMQKIRESGQGFDVSDAGEVKS